MNQGKRKRKINYAPLVLALLPALAFSCSSSIPAGPYLYNELNSSPFLEKEEEGYKVVGEFARFENNGKTIDTDFNSIFQSGNINFNMPTTGDVPLLVVPVDFSDKVGTAHDIELINSAFCGNRGSNQFLSVAEYYALSSMDRLHLRPYVIPSFFRSLTYSTISSVSSISSSSATTNALTKIYEECVAWLKESYSSLNLSSYSFKTKKGAEKLPIYFIYNAPYVGENGEETVNRNSMLWAFTVNRPAPISWSSLDMLHANNGMVDAHTYIHETGHLLGLEDYYDPSSTDAIARTSHLGRMDIMDSSLGDHNAFSKMLLGWERPFVPTSDCEITIHQASGNNESILVSPSWNGTPYDSYLLIEFYSPTNLNYVDAYLRSDPTMRLFQKPGVKIYKVDASLEIYNGYYSTGKALEGNPYNGERLYFGRKNSSFTKPLIQLLNKKSGSADPTPYFIASDSEEDVVYSIGGTNQTVHLSEALFYEGDGIDANRFSSLRIKDLPLGCSITVSKLTSGSATLKFEFAK